MKLKQNWKIRTDEYEVITFTLTDLIKIITPRTR